MAPHRDWTRRGAGRALLYWPLVAFLLAAAFPAIAVPLVVGSGFGLLTIGMIGGVAGRRRRARKLARARRAVAEPGEPARPGTGPTTLAGAGAHAPKADHVPEPWPTGRHAHRPRTRPVPAPPVAATPAPEAAHAPGRRDAA